MTTAHTTADTRAIRDFARRAFPGFSPKISVWVECSGCEECSTPTPTCCAADAREAFIETMYLVCGLVPRR